MKKIKIVCIGNYPPRECGIATFTKDLVDSLTKKRNRNGNDVDLYVIAISNQEILSWSCITGFGNPNQINSTIKGSSTYT